MTKIDAFVDRHGWQIVVFVVSAAVAWTTLQSQVANKAEKSDILVSERRLEVKIDSVARGQQQVFYLLCRQPEYRHDSACK